MALGFAERDGLAVADEGEAADFHLIARLLGLLFGEADAGDLRMAVGAAGDLLLLHRVDVVEAGDLLDADDALVLGLVGQHRRAGDVADGVDAGLPRAAVAIHLDDAALGLHLGALEPQVLDVALHADGGDHAVDGDLALLAGLLLAGPGHAVPVLLHRRTLRLGEQLHALLLAALSGLNADLLTLHRQDRPTQHEPGRASCRKRVGKDVEV